MNPYPHILTACLLTASVIGLSPAIAAGPPQSATPPLNEAGNKLESSYAAMLESFVTVSPDQHLLVAANDAQEPADITAPYTIGKWDKTPPVEISLVKGRNVLRFSRDGENIKGMTIKDFTLTPVTNATTN